jgi:hypothetical protein
MCLCGDAQDKNCVAEAEEIGKAAAAEKAQNGQRGAAECDVEWRKAARCFALAYVSKCAQSAKARRLAPMRRTATYLHTDSSARDDRQLECEGAGRLIDKTLRVALRAKESDSLEGNFAFTLFIGIEILCLQRAARQKGLK